jgi:flagellar basal-body rod protein FlgB
MLIDQLNNAGAMPALELTMRFAAQRQRLVAHNIANIDTPNFIQKDVSVGGFQETLDRAIRERRSRTGGMHGELAWEESGEVGRGARGGLVLTPDTPSGGVLFHDRNNRDIERLMQALAETTSAFRVAGDLYRNQRNIIDMAIAQRV